MSNHSAVVTCLLSPAIQHTSLPKIQSIHAPASQQNMSPQATPPASVLRNDDSWRPPPSDHHSEQDMATAEVLIDQLRGGGRDSQQPQSTTQDIPISSADPSNHRDTDYRPSQDTSGPSAPSHSSHPPSPVPPESRLQNPSTSPSGVTGQVCSNCGTTRTPLWRRSATGQTICNACGLYQKARNANRPPNLKRPPSYAPAFPAQSQNGQPSNGAPLPNGQIYFAPDHPTQGSCPGDGKCNGTGGSAACDGCPAFNNRTAKTAQIALAQPRDSTPGSARHQRGDSQEQMQGVAQAENVVIACQNCHTTTTPLWRRDADGHTICNACGLYYKLHGQHRPVEMKKTFIKRRKRVAPALTGQDHRVSQQAYQRQEHISTSPEASSGYAHSDASHPSPLPAPQVNIDPNLVPSGVSGPVPVDFTTYRPSAPLKNDAPPAHTYYDPLSDNAHHNSAPSPKRQRVSPVPNTATPAPTSSYPQIPASHRSLPIHSHAQSNDTDGVSPPSFSASEAPSHRPSDSGSQYNINPQDSEEDKRRKKLKREILRQQIAEMQRQVADLGESDGE